MSEYEIFNYHNPAGWACYVCGNWACGKAYMNQRNVNKQILMLDDMSEPWIQCEKCCKTFHLTCVKVTNIHKVKFGPHSAFVCCVRDSDDGKIFTFHKHLKFNSMYIKLNCQ